MESAYIFLREWNIFYHHTVVNSYKIENIDLEAALHMYWQPGMITCYLIHAGFKSS